jgi:hypothetical protein
MIMIKQHSPRIQRLNRIMQDAAEAKFAMAKYQKDAGMMAMYAGDARDMFDIAAKMEAGNFVAAMRQAQSMDTAARDEIPTEVYKFLEHVDNADIGRYRQ